MTTIRHHSHTRSLLATVAVAIPAMLISSGLSAPSAQAAYIVTLDEVGSNVVADGSGTIDFTDLTPISVGIHSAGAIIQPSGGNIRVGSPNGSNYDGYTGITGPTSFGVGAGGDPSFGSGGLVGIDNSDVAFTHPGVVVPSGYVSGSALADTTMTFNNQSFASIGVTPATYVWTWGSGADADSFTLQIGPAVVPAPLIDRGLPVLLAVGGLLFGAKLFERGKRRRLQLG